MFGAAVIVAWLSVSHFSQPNGLPANAVCRRLPQVRLSQGGHEEHRQAHVVVDRQPAVGTASVVDVDSGDQTAQVSQ